LSKSPRFSPREAHTAHKGTGVKSIVATVRSRRMMAGRCTVDGGQIARPHWPHFRTLSRNGTGLGRSNDLD
jgi:hypothetical protein